MDEHQNPDETTSTPTPPSASDAAPSPAVAEALDSLENEPAINPFEAAAPAAKPAKSKKGLYALATICCLAIIGTCAWFLFGQKPAANSNVQADVAEPAPDLEPIPASKLALKGSSLSDFDLAFLRLENTQGNVVYSPLSIKYALAMLMDGANGRSKEQIAAVIGDYQPKAYLNSANRSLANAMFIRTDFSEQVKQSFKDTLDGKYHASVILDPFTSPDNANKWVEDKTLGIIKNTFSEHEINTETDYVLINALAINMKWRNQIQCAKAEEYVDGQWNDLGGVPCIRYEVHYQHENYSDGIHDAQLYGFAKHSFNGNDVETAEIAATYNKYDVIKENGGEAAVRAVVQQKYNEWLAEVQADEQRAQFADTNFNLDEYIESLASHYGKSSVSSDYYFLDTDTEKVFAKDLQEYDGSTLQYVGIMPKSGSLNAYLNQLTADKATSLIASLKDVSDANNFKEGVITRVKGYIPFFKFNFTMDSFMNHLESLGITDVFSTQDADLSNMIEFDASLSNKPYIDIAIHKADITFSNDGIKAGAVTALGGMGAGGPEYFDYIWDVPVEEIDLTFDRPFLFLIRDKATGEVWFTGTVYSPAN